MRVRCVRSHEKPPGVVYHAGREYDLDDPSPAHFEPVEEPTPVAVCDDAPEPVEPKPKRRRS